MSPLMTIAADFFLKEYRGNMKELFALYQEYKEWISPNDPTPTELKKINLGANDASALGAEGESSQSPEADGTTGRI